ncbi:anillin, actin binding protein 2 isoform X1 [Chanodichthys erythropterus]|uniref:anillin, actin binding protein 2 isoform X1 n=1 Tax=Chanodichthys erythropterus TaxID=933992 RepID=UPI00351F0143
MENQKRPRDPLEENTSACSELENVLKKRRLAAGGEENLDPTKSPARTRSRLAELEVKPDTPAISSIRSRVQQLSQRRDGGTGLVQRCLSDPGSEGCGGSMTSAICHIGEGEFSSRLQRFKAPTPLNSPAPSTPCTRNLSSFVHGIQQQLNAAVTPSTKEASRIRQAREDELRLLKVQPVADNMWLKRSLSDSSLTEEELKGTEFSSCEGDSKVFDGSLNTTPPCTVDIRFPNEELYTSTEPEALSTSTLIDKMFEDVLQHAEAEDKGEDGNKEEEVELEKVESNSSQTEKVDKTEPDTVEMEDKPELVTVDMEDKPEPVIVTLNEEPLDHSEMCEESVETPDVSSAVDEEKELQSDHGEGEIEGKQEIATMGAEDDFLTLPPSCILSPLSKSVEAVVTPLKIEITVSEPSVQPPSPEEMTASPAENVPPLYSIDAYRSQRKIHPPSTQSLTPGVQKPVQEKTSKKPINIKERIKALNEEAAKLQTIITQTLQALSCCSDEEHGKGSQQEAEAEKLLLVSSEKRAALLAEVSRLREGESGQPESQNASLQACRGTVSISSIQLPLKVEFVCSARTGRPTHYFFVLVRYGPCNIVATPLATAADAQNGDTISFPTSITLQDIRSSFEIDVEVYSLSSTQSNTCSVNTQQFRSSTKSRVTPKKILHSITKSNQSVTSATLPGLSAQRSSNFTLVGSHKITLNSLGRSKFLLDKMKFEGKIRRLLGDEFQEKVPFLSPLEGHIYMQLHSEGHSNVQHQGFLTMFEDVSGFGAWQRFYFLLEGGHLLYWNYPNEMGNKPADGSLSLFSFCSVRPVERECCARPHTFELVETNTLQQEDSQTLKKCWFSADTREERADWMEKLNQTLLDSLTWNRKPVSNDNRASTSSNTGTSRESIL